MPKNKNNFFETNIIIPKINKKRNTKCPKNYEIVHLMVDISILVVKCAFRIRFNDNFICLLFFNLILTRFFLCAKIYFVIKKCGCGGTGRRAGLRNQCQRRGGSSPLIRTNNFFVETKISFRNE